MKKLTSVLMAGMLAATSCVCAITASATDDTTAKINVVDDFMGQPGTTTTYDVKVGDKIECAVVGYSDKDITAVMGATLFNQKDAEDFTEYSDIDVLGYADGYYEETGLFYDTGDFSTMAVRPEDSSEFDRDVFSYCYILGRPSGTYAEADGQVIVKFALEVKSAGECTIKNLLQDVTYDDANGDIVSDDTAVRTAIKLNVVSSGETPTDATEATAATEATVPTEATAPTEATIATEVVTVPSTVAPTSATNATSGTNATSAATSGATSATNATNKPSTGTNTNSNNNSSTTGKVATGESTSIALILAVLFAVSGVVVVARKKING